MESNNQKLLISKLGPIFVICSLLILGVIIYTGYSFFSALNGQKTRLASMRGPANYSIIKIIKDNTLINNYNISNANNIDDVCTNIIEEQNDISIIPFSTACKLYNTTSGSIKVLDISNLNMLNILSQNTSINKVSDLTGKRLYLYGRNSITGVSIEIILQKRGVSLSDIDIVYLDTVEDVTKAIINDPSAYGVVSEPHATNTIKNNPLVKEVFDLNHEWKRIFGRDSELITGVTVAGNSFIKNNSQKVDEFLSQHRESIEFLNDNPEEASEIWKNLNIDNSELNPTIIKNSHISFYAGDDMKKRLSNYIKIIYEYAPSLIADNMPDENFYYKSLKWS